MIYDITYFLIYYHSFKWKIKVIKKIIKDFDRNFRSIFFFNYFLGIIWVRLIDFLITLIGSKLVFNFFLEKDDIGISLFILLSFLMIITLQIWMVSIASLHWHLLFCFVSAFFVQFSSPVFTPSFYLLLILLSFVAYVSESLSVYYLFPLFLNL